MQKTKSDKLHFLLFADKCKTPAIHLEKPNKTK